MVGLSAIGQLVTVCNLVGVGGGGQDHPEPLSTDSADLRPYAVSPYNLTRKFVGWRVPPASERFLWEAARLRPAAATLGNAREGSLGGGGGEHPPASLAIRTTGGTIDQQQRATQVYLTGCQRNRILVPRHDRPLGSDG